MDKKDRFWQWFQDHNEELVAMGELDEKGRRELETALQYQLSKYCEGLTYEIGDASSNGRTLTITAEGDTDLFRYVVELVDAAPDLDWWEFVAFKQPMGTELKIHFDKLLFDTGKMFFQQLECEEEPEMLGLRIAVDGGDRQDEDFQVGVYVTLEALLGEFDCATLIGYMDTVPLMDEPFKSGYNPLDDLPRFAEWFKQKRDE